MVQLVDIFAKPLICLLRELVQWFHDNDIKFVPEAIFMDVQDSINHAHPEFHSNVSQVNLVLWHSDDPIVLNCQISESRPVP